MSPMTAPGPPTSPAVVGGEVTSALYEGTLHHRRWGPGTANDFSYRVAMPLIDLDGVEAVTSAHPLWSNRLPAPVWFRRADFLGPPAQPLA